MKRHFLFLLGIAILVGTGIPAQIKNIVLVHGAFADGSGWQKVYNILKADGYNVSVVGNPNTGLEDDVAATKRVIDRQDGPVILVGHSYGGAIITAAGTSNKVVGLVYIAAFAPDEGESLIKLLTSYPRDTLSGILKPVDGFVWYDRDKYHAGFCQDLPADEAAFMADSQVPAAASAFSYVFKDIAWKKKPNWYIVAAQDHSIPPDLERSMAKRMHADVVEIQASHLVFISHPLEAALIIEKAAKGVAKN